MLDVTLFQVEALYHHINSCTRNWGPWGGAFYSKIGGGSLWILFITLTKLGQIRSNSVSYVKNGLHIVTNVKLGQNGPN
jgi:hypothetical protein